MSREINFLSDRHKQIVKQEVADRKVMFFCAIGLAVSFALVLIFSGVQFYFSYHLTQIKNQETADRSQIVGNQDTERSFVIFVHKLSGLAQIDQDRLDKRAIIQFFSTFFGNQISVIGVELNQQQKLLTLQLQANSVFEIKGVLTQLNSQTLLDKYHSVSPSNLTRTQDGKYQIDLTVSTVASSSSTL